MNDKGKIFALDKNKRKVQELERTIKALGFTCITAMNTDAAKASSKFAAESFDRIVLDPPCSGLGNRPRFLDEMPAKTLAGYSDYQRRIFAEAMKLLKPGGTLVYSTCTINPEENEETVQWALDSYPQHLELVDPPQNLKFGLPGLTTAKISEEYVQTDHERLWIFSYVS
jgi:16S rRNA C967 or C1407 C5-methylase (RsmB/RsmF family)